MPRQASLSIDNNFRNGLITEATGLNFPENACTATYNCVFDLDGSVYRRLGFDFENGYQTKTIDRDDCAVARYLWKNVAGNGSVTLLVLQVGLTLHFYEITADNSTSSGEILSTVTLSAVGGTLPESYECQFSDGNGYLVVTHPYCNPVRVSYDATAHTVSSTSITIKIRDFEGSVADPYDVDTRPTATLGALNVDHKYNLMNQGWTTANLTAWDTAQTTMPSNADVMWQFKNSTNDFDFATASLARVTSGNTPAPKGHYILTLSNQDRDGAAGTTGVAATTTGNDRPSLTAFFAGRVFYAGINRPSFNSNIYFTQIIERVSQYGAAYQVNDPTAEDLFDLLPSDGGVISIPEAGTIYKLVSIPGGLSVHAENGVWFITGSSGIGFAANDYSVQKISSVPAISSSSFVDVMGLPAWWNSEGIYILVAQSNSNLPTVQSLTDSKIKSFYQDISSLSKRYAQGIYHYTDGHIRWVYRSTPYTTINERYEYDRVLNFNVQTGAFYPWTISDSDVKVNGIIVSELISGNIAINNVITNSSDNVVDASGNQVVTYTNSGSEQIPFDKYIVSYPNGNSYDFTFASKINSSYVDWSIYDNEGVNFDSYFTTGYKVRGNAIRKFQPNWTRVFSRTTEPVSYYYQGLWDFANTGSDTGRWSVQQLVEHTDTNYSNSSKRLKVRGHGLVLQFKVDSVDGQPFDIIGWANNEYGNAVP